MAIFLDKVLMLIIVEGLVQPHQFQTSTYNSAYNTLELDRIRALNMTEHIQNEADRALIIEQLVYCSSQSLCSIRNVNERSNNSSCCTPCSCENTCTLSGSCCMDKALAENNLDILSRKGSSCVLPQLKPFEENGLNTDDRFLMIGFCHNEFMDSSIIKKCHIGQSSTNGTNVKDYLPVSSGLTNETYRNRHCAYCNFEQDTNLKYWETSFSCQESLFVVPKKARELLRFSFEEQNCNLFYQPPPDLMSFPCRDETHMITECNVTGVWTEYNSTIDWACSHYQNQYVADFVYYKNVFCYICNANSSSPPSCFDGPGGGLGGSSCMTSFTALFNFIEDTPTEQSRNKTHFCPTDFRFDTHKNICREITCLPPFKYRNGVCENAFSRIAFQKYEMFLRFNKAPTFYTNCDICPQLSPLMIQEYMRIRLTNMGYYRYVCGLSVLNTNDGCSLSPTNTGYLIIHVELYIRHFHDPIEVVEHFLNDSAFQFESTSGEICIELQPKVLGGKFYEFESGKNAYDYVSPLARRYTDPSNGKKLNVKIYPETGTCVFKPWVARLVPAFICPLVNISLSEYNVTSQTNILCLDTQKICFKPEEFIFSDNNSSVLICAENYFASPVPEYTIASEEDLGKVLVSIVCACLSILCLIITMVTYMLFPVLRTLSGLNTMALYVTLIVAHALFTFGAGAVQIGFVCEVLGMIIHLTMLASVFLMNVCSIHMFRVFSHLDRPVVLTEEEKRRHFLIALVYSYGSSAIFVIGRIVYSVVTTGTSGYGIRVCFINNPIALLFTFTLPVMLLVIANIVMFCIVIVKVSQLPDMSRSSTCRHQQKRFFIYIKLSSLTGVAWLFGFIDEISHLDIFVYLYVILIAGQGVFIMLSFVCNKRVYKLYSSYRKQVSGQSTSRCHTILDNTLSKSPYIQSIKPHAEATTTPTGIRYDKYHPTGQDNICHESSTKL